MNESAVQILKVVIGGGSSDIAFFVKVAFLLSVY